MSKLRTDHSLIDYLSANSTAIGEHGNRRANGGYVFRCGACGKLSQDWYGNERISPGWDVSCTLNAELVEM